MWDDLGYQHLALSSQNLRDCATALEKTLGDSASDIVSQNSAHTVVLRRILSIK